MTRIDNFARGRSALAASTGAVAMLIGFAAHPAPRAAASAPAPAPVPAPAAAPGSESGSDSGSGSGSGFIGNPVHGKIVYQACMACHSLDDDDVGPRHRGVVGRAAGSVPGFAYSPALRHSGLVWDPATLDRWLTNPQTLVPGAKMFFLLPGAQDRADVIAYLAQQK